jgi:glycosyltransferase involved in cell wall biosynthesis
VHAHAGTLHDARNQALAMVETEWVIHLDADDELEPGYVDTLAAGAADLRAPSVRYVRHGRERRPWMPQVSGHSHACEAACLRDGNWLVIGTMARAQLIRDVGGWRDFPWSEDWDVWLRCWLAGATVEAVPAAVYRAHVRPDSRNRAPAREARLAAHQAIVAANFGAPA